mgnify:CR=1 FL=1
MSLKQISLAMPENLFHASKEYSEEFGYKNIQELILDLVRRRVILENIERYRQIEERMKKGIGVRSFAQKDAVRYLKGL